jgi:hypothetical protein
MARAVRGKAATEARIRAVAAHARERGGATSGGSPVACPILADNACSEYVSRPSVCRVVMSTSLPRCLDILRDGRGGEFAYPAGAEAMRTYAAMMLRAALLVVNMPHQHYEMSQALEVVLSTRNAEARWLAGEPIFANVPVDRAEIKGSGAIKLSDALAAAVKLTI